MLEPLTKGEISFDCDNNVDYLTLKNDSKIVSSEIQAIKFKTQTNFTTKHVHVLKWVEMA